MGTANSTTQPREENEGAHAGVASGKTQNIEAEIPCMSGKKTFDIAITGNTGTGKSSLVNALREMKTDEEIGAAMTCVIEHTHEPTGYVHPKHPEVTLWDLPGMGTSDFKAEEYVKVMDLWKYDSFIVVSDERFTENDQQLVREILKMKKKLYYVRTKIDLHIKNEKRKANFCKEKMMETIRADCCRNLINAGETSPRVFLISRRHLEEYDLPLLQRSLWDELDKVKKQASMQPLDIKNRKLNRVAQAMAKIFFKIDLQKLIDALEGKSAEEVAAEVNEELKLLENTTLDIAITGRSGTGKSSLVNALRGMNDDDVGACETGVVQTTMEPQEYPHPVFPKVKIWDLPGIGTPDFEAAKYLKQVNFRQYDFFIIVASGRFTQHDAMLACEIQKMKKRFYFVRSKVDESIENEKKKKNFNEVDTLERIRNDCLGKLTKTGETSPRVFLMSRWDLGMYDFPLLSQTLENDLDGLKKHALVLASPVSSKEVMERKKAAMESLIWKLALVSLFFGAIPVPGLSFACDLAILAGAMKLFCKVFGLDEDCLRRLAKQVGKPYEVLKAAVKNVPLVAEINKKLAAVHLGKTALFVTVSAIELALDFIPVVGSIAGGVISFITTAIMLRIFLRDVVTDATNVWAVAKSP